MNTECEPRAKIQARQAAGRFVCIGLDPDIGKIPSAIRTAHRETEEAIFAFNRAIIDATAEYACAFKPNSAFYEAHGESGMRALKRTAGYLHERYADIPVILDAKRADIGSTNEAYAKAIFDDLGMDAVTLHPYLGREALQPFLDRKDKMLFVLVRTSNPGAGEFQDLAIGGMPLYQKVALHVASEWNQNGNCGIVVGATYPEELRAVRGIVGDMDILVPGIGAQGGDLKKAISLGKGEDAFALIINSARGIIYASSGDDFADAAKAAAATLNTEITAAL